MRSSQPLKSSMNALASSSGVSRSRSRKDRRDHTRSPDSSTPSRTIFNHAERRGSACRRASVRASSSLLPETDADAVLSDRSSAESAFSEEAAPSATSDSPAFERPSGCITPSEGFSGVSSSPSLRSAEEASPSSYFCSVPSPAEEAAPVLPLSSPESAADSCGASRVPASFLTADSSPD